MTYYRLLRVIDDREQCVYGNLLIACQYQTAIEYIVICQLGIPVSRYMDTRSSNIKLDRYLQSRELKHCLIANVAQSDTQI